MTASGMGTQFFEKRQIYVVIEIHSATKKDSGTFLNLMENYLVKLNVRTHIVFEGMTSMDIVDDGTFYA
jgi:hypothetical protein